MKSEKAEEFLLENSVAKSSGTRENLKETAGVADEFFHDRSDRRVFMRDDQKFIIQIQILNRTLHDRGWKRDRLAAEEADAAGAFDQFENQAHFRGGKDHRCL